MTAAGGPRTPDPAAGGAVSGDLAHDLSQMARALQGQDDVQGTLDVIVAGAVGTVPGAQHASISAIRRRREVETLASTGEVPRAVDQAQYDTQQGPCLDTLYDAETVRLPDLGAEHWPDFIARAQALGVGSMLAVQLFATWWGRRRASSWSASSSPATRRSPCWSGRARRATASCTTSPRSW